jgi:PAS domain S-box-containing protein
MQFLYLAPVGLVQAGIDGEIVMINPISAQLLMPLSPDGNLTNLFTRWKTSRPTCATSAGSTRAPTAWSSRACTSTCARPTAHARRAADPVADPAEARRRAPHGRDPDVTAEQVRRERQLRQSDAWLNAILTRISDYALAALDREGRLCDWNDSIARVTGFGEHVVGSPYSIFYPPDAMTAEHLLDRLREADHNGWSMDEGLRLRADGSQFWGSALIAPLPDRDAFDPTTRTRRPTA